MFLEDSQSLYTVTIEDVKCVLVLNSDASLGSEELDDAVKNVLEGFLEGFIVRKSE